MELTIVSSSVENIEVGVESNDDPTTGTVEIGLVSDDGDTPPSSWVAGTWNGRRTVSRGPGEGFVRAWVGRFLFGAGGLDVGVGTYHVWVRVSAGAEDLVRKTDDVITVV